MVEQAGSHSESGVKPAIHVAGYEFIHLTTIQYTSVNNGIDANNKPVCYSVLCKVVNRMTKFHGGLRSCPSEGN